jgi:hypothetical protein
MHGYYSNAVEHGNNTNNITSSTDYAQEGSLEQELLFCPFSCPAWLSLDSSMNTCGLRHFSGLAKAIRKGISPMYMADPSESTPAEVPDWLIEFRKKDAERKRIKKYGTADGKKKKEKAPVPARLRSEKCRRNKGAARVAPAESATTTGATYVSSTIFPILSILITDILSFLVAIVCMM